MSEDSIRVELGFLLQDQLRKAGIALEIRNPTVQELFGDRLPHGNFDLVEFVWIGNPFAVSANRDIYTTGSDSNYGRFTERRIHPAGTAQHVDSVAQLGWTKGH